MKRAAIPAAFALSLFLAACAGGTAGAPGAPRINPERITRAEIDQAGPSSAYDLIQKLRPLWLRKRGNTSFTQDTDVAVYLDGTRMGDREALRTIDSTNIERLEFLDARRATARFGIGHTAGAILVVTRG